MTRPTTRSQVPGASPGRPGPSKALGVQRHDDDPSGEPDHQAGDDVLIPAFLAPRTGLLETLLQQCRVLPVEVQDGPIAKEEEPYAEYPTFPPFEVPGKLEDEHWEQQDEQQ